MTINFSITPDDARRRQEIAPERFTRPALINLPYAGIGGCRFEPNASPEFWYYAFHGLP
jgi:hypothetical protein